MAMHYEEIVLMNGACLVPLLYGESETGTKLLKLMVDFLMAFLIQHGKTRICQ